MAVIISRRSSYCPNFATTPFLFSSGILRTASRSGTWWVLFFDANAVNGISVTSAEEIQRPVSSLTVDVIRAVTDTSAPAVNSALILGWS